MELYLSACSKTANVAANKAASSSVAEDSQQCREVSGVASGQCGCPGPQSGLGVVTVGLGLGAATALPAPVWLGQGALGWLKRGTL